MKYLICALPMVLCVEVVSLLCLIAMCACFFADIAKAKEVR